MEDYDCLVVGGGPAGLTAATYLARYRRRLLLVDGGRPRARLIPVAHTVPGFPDGISGIALLDRLRRQAALYGVEAEAGLVTAIERSGESFLATASHTQGQVGTVRARTVLLATGVVDIEPALPELADAIAGGLVRHCPVCDGWEIQGRRIGVLGFGRGGMNEALFLRTWSDAVSLLTLGAPLGLAAEEEHRLKRAGIAIFPQPVTQLYGRTAESFHITLADGESLHVDTLYSALGARIRSDLGVRLGAEAAADGTLACDAHQRTTVAGLWAAGDVAASLNQVAVATAHAAIAATSIHRSLGDNPYGG